MFSSVFLRVCSGIFVMHIQVVNLAQDDSIAVLPSKLGKKSSLSDFQMIKITFNLLTVRGAYIRLIVVMVNRFVCGVGYFTLYSGS